MRYLISLAVAALALAVLPNTPACEDLPEALRMVYRRLFVDLGVWP